MATRKTRLIASGGFGKVFASGKIAGKHIYSRKNCQESISEYANILKLYLAYNELLENCSNKRLKQKLRKIKPLQPVEFKEGKHVHEGTEYFCQMHTTLIKGLKTKTLELGKAVEELFPQLLVMPVFDGDTALQLVSDGDISLENPPRYFVWNINDKTRSISDYFPKLDFDVDFPYCMGIVLALFFFGANMNMTDVEVLLGANSKINLVDMGMCKDIHELIKTDDPKRIAAEMLSVSGPFYTKCSFPTEKGRHWDQFKLGFFDTCQEYDLSSAFVTNIWHDISKEFNIKL
jgi:predicted DNA-binding antitoxin AbrB/MazE fold protein